MQNLFFKINYVTYVKSYGTYVVNLARYKAYLPTSYPLIFYP